MNEAVKFLKGTQESFNGLKSYQPGAFYLVIDDTVDSTGKPTNSSTFGKPGRLYYGVNSTTIAPVNQGITTVKNTSELSTMTSKLDTGKFYYSEAENILCILNGDGRWIQVNVNTALSQTLSSLQVGPTNNDNEVKVVQRLVDNNNNTIEFTHTFVGDDHITISNDEGNKIVFKLTGINYTLTEGLSNVDAEGTQKKLDFTLSNEGKEPSTVSIVPGPKLNFVDDGGKFTLTLDNEINIFESNPIDGAGDKDTGFNIKIGGSAVVGDEKSITIDPTITINNKDYKFKGGNLALDVYTKTDIDTKLRTLNAMVYRGAITAIADNGKFTFSNSSLNDGTESLHNGDTFIYSGNDVTYNNNIVRSGDLFIASGVENESGNLPTENIEWIYIPSANEPLVEIGDTLNSDNLQPDFTIQQGLEKLFRLALKSGAGINIGTEINDKDKIITIGHTASHTAATASTETQVFDQAFTITVNNPKTIDEQGHVTESQSTTYTLKDTHATIEKENYTFAEGTLVPQIKVDGLSKELSPIDIISDTLKISGSGTTEDGANANIHVELEWGSF